jgi:hypothetical protein
VAREGEAGAAAAPTGVTAKVTDECTSRWPLSAGQVQTAGNLACPPGIWVLTATYA